LEVASRTAMGEGKLGTIEKKFAAHQCKGREEGAAKKMV